MTSRYVAPNYLSTCPFSWWLPTFNRVKQRPAVRSGISGIRSRSIEANLCVMCLASAFRGQQLGDTLGINSSHDEYNCFKFGIGIKLRNSETALLFAASLELGFCNLQSELLPKTKTMHTICRICHILWLEFWYSNTISWPSVLKQVVCGPSMPFMGSPA